MSKKKKKNIIKASSNRINISRGNDDEVCILNGKVVKKPLFETSAYILFRDAFSGFWGKPAYIRNADKLQTVIEEKVMYTQEHAVIGELNSLPDYSGAVPSEDVLYIRRATPLTQDVAFRELNKADENKVTRTYVVICKRKKAEKILSDSSKNRFIRAFLMGSSLYPVLNCTRENKDDETNSLGTIQEEWLYFNNKYYHADATVIMYLPNIYIPGENNEGDNANILMIAVPDMKDIPSINEINKGDDNDISKMMETITEKNRAYFTRIINDVAAAAVKLECKRLVINPFSELKEFRSELHMLSELWPEVMNSETCKKMIPDIIYTNVEDDTASMTCLTKQLIGSNE